MSKTLDELTNFRCLGFYVPKHMHPAIDRYLNEHIKPADFLSAVICNDLTEAVQRADAVNIQQLPAFVTYFYHYAPPGSWGSKEAFDKWLAKGEKKNKSK